jgi:hypothetical protein
MDRKILAIAMLIGADFWLAVALVVIHFVR